MLVHYYNMGYDYMNYLVVMSRPYAQLHLCNSVWVVLEFQACSLRVCIRYSKRQHYSDITFAYMHMLESIQYYARLHVCIHN